MSRNFGIGSFDLSMMEMRRKRDHKSLRRICDLCLELEYAIIEFNDNQEYSFTPLFHANETVGNIRIIATIMANRTRETSDLDNKQENEEKND